MASISKIQTGINILENGFETLCFSIVFHCNLNCAYCGALSPLSDEYFVNIDNFKKYIERLPQIVPPDKFDRIHIAGGEPLLHPNIIDIVTYTRKSYPTKKIEIITNGLLLNKMSDDFKKCLHDNHINIDISDYKVLNNKEDLIKDYAKFGISLKFSNKDQFYCFTYDLEGKQDKNQSLEYCKYCNCLSLIEDKFYICGTDFFIRRNLGPYLKTEISSEDSGESIFNSENYYEIISKLINKFPIDSCKFCKFPIREEKWKLSKEPHIKNFI